MNKGLKHQAIACVPPTLCSAGSLMNKGLKLSTCSYDAPTLGSAGSLMNKGLKPLPQHLVLRRTVQPAP